MQTLVKLYCIVLSFAEAWKYIVNCNILQFIFNCCSEQYTWDGTQLPFNSSVYTAQMPVTTPNILQIENFESKKAVYSSRLSALMNKLDFFQLLVHEESETFDVLAWIGLNPALFVTPHCENIGTILYCNTWRQHNILDIAIYCNILFMHYIFTRVCLLVSSGKLCNNYEVYVMKCLHVIMWYHSS